MPKRIGLLMLPPLLAFGAATGLGAPPSGAATYTSCASLRGLDLAGQTDALGGCSAPTGGSGTFTGPLQSPLTLTWSGGGTTTVSFAVKTYKKTKCPGGATELALTGHATASTAPAQTIRGMFFAHVCVDQNDQLSLLPGKPLLLQS